MKIVCTKKEFAQLIRDCNGMGRIGACAQCVLADFCGDQLVEDAVEFELTEDE